MENNIFGKTIKIERVKEALTGTEIAKKIGISRSYLSDIENGRILPGAKILAKMDDIFPKANLFSKYKKSIQK